MYKRNSGFSACLTKSNFITSRLVINRKLVRDFNTAFIRDRCKQAENRITTMIIDELKEKGINTTERVVEYLSQNNNGSHFLPENLAELIAEIAKSSAPRSCINLNSNIGEILSKCVEIEKRLGIEINAQNIEIANYLNPKVDFDNSNPIKHNAHTKYDVVICFPPLGKRISINGRKEQSEILYISKSLELLNENGTAILLLPNNFLTAPVYEEIRSEIIENYGIKQIISLPQGVIRSTGVELSILEINRQTIEKTKFFAVKSKNLKPSEIVGKSADFEIPKDSLRERWDYNFHNPIHKKYEEQLRNYETRKIEELVEITMGVPFKSEERIELGNIQILSPRNIANGKFEPSDNDKYLNKSEFNNREEKAILKDGDIILPRFYRDKIGVYIHNSYKNKLIANQHLIILRGKNAEYVATYLNTENGINLFNQQIKRHASGNVIPTISLRDLKSIQIPILPIEDLELASKRKLEKLSYEELFKLNEKYISLKSEFNNLKKENIISAHEAQLSSMQETLNEVLSNQKEIATKLDGIKSTLVELTNDFKQIKDLPRDIDEKIIRLNENLDSKLDNLLKDQKQIDFYIAEIKRWFDFYDILETKSQKYLPEAEYIFDHISKLENPDYSPFILQYCRALENELLKKIFRAYVQSLINKNIDLEKDFAWDFGRKESGKLNNDNTFKLAKHLQRCLSKPKEEWFFELGSMEVNLRYLTGKTVEKSLLLQDLKSFVLNRFKQEFLNIEYLDEIKTIIRDYRNQSAHPNLIDTEKAVKFHKQMKKCLISLMENYKQ